MFTLDCIRLDCIPRRMPHSNSLSSLATLHSTLGYPSTPDTFARLLLNIRPITPNSFTLTRLPLHAGSTTRQMKGRICRTGGRVHGGRVGQVGEYTVGEGGIWLVNIG
ncbi:hypothetical protein C353_06497 [Cryptococcus neoformans AD1-83a]|nr:hypothetical protein C353_06497 [Cryptococcus neoformans var. grubii AD1-83a]